MTCCKMRNRKWINSDFGKSYYRYVTEGNSSVSFIFCSDIFTILLSAPFEMKLTESS